MRGKTSPLRLAMRTGRAKRQGGGASPSVHGQNDRVDRTASPPSVRGGSSLWGREQMNGGAREPLDIVAAIGGAFGVAGTFVGPDALRQELWLVDGVALVVATAL